MKPRILTIQLEVLDVEKAKWIWENHMGDREDLGVYIKVIQDGEIPRPPEDK